MILYGFRNIKYRCDKYDTYNRWFYTQKSAEKFYDYNKLNNYIVNLDELILTTVEEKDVNENYIWDTIIDPWEPFNRMIVSLKQDMMSFQDILNEIEEIKSKIPLLTLPSQVKEYKKSISNWENFAATFL